MIDFISGWIGTMLGAAGEYESSVARENEALENRMLAEQAAGDALARGAFEAGRMRITTGQLIARQHVAYATSGVDPTVGTPAEVQADTRALGELDASMLENNAAREAWGLRMRSQQFGKAAELERRQRPQRLAATILGGAGRGLGSY